MTTTDFAALDDTALWTLGNALMDNLMEASTRIDHAAHVRDFSVRARAIVTPEHLERVCRAYQAEKGFFAAREPVALFRRPTSVAFVWRQFYTRAAGEYLAEMIIIREDDVVRVDHVVVY